MRRFSHPHVWIGGFGVYSGGPKWSIMPGVLSIRAARRYRWRLAGGRLIAENGGLRFAPNRLERRRTDTFWECTAEHVTGVRVRGKVWLVVDTVVGAQTFRVFGASAAAPRLEEALHRGD
jgi:hypothetical protein